MLDKSKSLQSVWLMNEVTKYHFPLSNTTFDILSSVFVLVYS